jgi:hypothetical protein
MGSNLSTSLTADEKGVLIPPSFGVSTNALPPSSSAARRPSPQYLENVEKDLLCYRILHDHMVSGLWVSATTPSDASVLASFVVSNNGSDSDTNSSAEGMLSACQKWSHGQADIRAHTLASAIASAHYVPLPGWNVYGSADASGLAWLGCHVSPLTWIRPPSQAYYRNNPFADEEKKTAAEKTIQKIQLGSSLQLQYPGRVTSLSDMELQHVRGYASADVAGCTVVVEATLPMKTLDPHVAHFFSANLSSADEGPPLMFSIQSSPTASSMSLSQVLTFDRRVANVFETRCPRIRNTLGWAVQMKRERDADDAQLTAGLAWQVNRGLCVKLVANPTDSGLTGALLLKRWRQPRVLLSLLAGMDSGKKVSYGFGLELETGPQLGQDYYRDKEENRRHVEEQAPATKVTFPNVD